MTINILEAKQQLLSYFVGKNSIAEDEILSLVDKKCEKENGEAAIRIALKELEESKIVSKTVLRQGDNKFKEVWVLEKPLVLYEQNVVLDGQTALKVSSYVNNFYQTIGENEMGANPLNIIKDDIMVLLDIIDLYAQSNVPEKKGK